MPKYIVQMRRGTTEEWAAHSDIIPRDGEIVIETLEDGGKNLYIGDGVTPFEHLTPFSSGADIDEKLNKKADRVNGTVISANQTFADLREWVDGNPSEEDRFGYFVTFGTNGKIQKATSANVVTGVVIQSAGFSTGVSPDKLNEDDTIKGAYDFVAFNGLVTVRDDGTPIIGDYCIASDEGVATASPNSFGYKVVERVDATHINIYFSTNADALKRLQDNIDSAIESIVIDLVTTTKAGLMSPADKIKLDAIEEGAQVNQNAFANVKVGSQTVSAQSTNADVNFAAGKNIEISIDDDNNIVVTSTAADTDVATKVKDGLMSAADKKRLDELQGVDVTDDVPADDVRIWIDPSEDYGDIFAAVQMTPTIVDSMDQMTDTKKLYVLTTDSHVYFYDNGAWQDSGMSYSGTTVVQETGDSSTSVMSQEAVTKELSSTWSLAVPKTGIPTGADLNSYTEPGTYRITSATIAQSLLNVPTPQPGSLIVTQLYNVNRLFQFYFDLVKANVYFRNMRIDDGNITCSVWKQIGLQEDIDAAMSHMPVVVNNSAWELGGIDTSGKNITSSIVIRSADFYPVVGGTLIRFLGVWRSSNGAARIRLICTYDADKQFLQRIQVASDIILDDNVKYVKFAYGYTTSDETSHEIDNVEQFAKYIKIEVLKPTQRDIEAVKSSLHFNNHMCQLNLDMNDNGFKYIHDNDGDDYIETDPTLSATPMIYGEGAYLCLSSFNMDIINSSSTVSNLYVYLYNKTSSGEFRFNKTLFYPINDDGVIGEITRTYDGRRVLKMSDNMYFRIVYDSKADYVPDVIIWDGEHIGGDVSLGVWYRTKPSGEGATRNVAYHPSVRQSMIVIPGNAKHLFIKNDPEHPEDMFEVRRMRAYTEDNTYASIYYSADDGYGTECITLPTDRKYKEFLVCLAYAHPHGAAECRHVFIGDANDRVSYDCEYTIDSMPLGAGRLIINQAKTISGVRWECKKELVCVGNRDHFNQGEIYNGIPYASYWSVPKAYGWHISKHTFINAANDEDSIFYNEHSTKDDAEGNVYEYGSGYGLVCSSFGTLTAGMPYPTATKYMHFNPDLQLLWTNNIEPGTLCTLDDHGHCFIFESSHHSSNGRSFSLYESAGPVCGRRSMYAFDTLPMAQQKISYCDKYRYTVHTKTERNDSPYNITQGTIVNGYARPYRGDKSTYTNLQDVKINIKEGSTKLYVREYFITSSEEDPKIDVINWRDDYQARVYDVSGTSFIIPTADLVGDTTPDRTAHSKFFAVWTEKSLNGAPPTEVPAVYECFEFVILPVLPSYDNTWSIHKVSDFVSSFTMYNQMINPARYSRLNDEIRVTKLYGTTVRAVGNNPSSACFVTLTSPSDYASDALIVGHKYFFNPLRDEDVYGYHYRINIPHVSGAAFTTTSTRHIFSYDSPYSAKPYIRLQFPTNTNIPEPIDLILGCVDLTRLFGAGNEPSDESDVRLVELAKFMNAYRLYSAPRMLDYDEKIWHIPDIDFWYTRLKTSMTIPKTNDYTKYAAAYPKFYDGNANVFCKGHYAAYMITIQQDNGADPGPEPEPDDD